MKRKLIFIMAVALTTLIIRAGVNPRIVKVNLDIDGMVDGPAEFGTALEPGGPGGFVTKGGWKKIKLSVEGAGSARLNWNSDKIGVYMTPGGAALSTTREKIWTDVATMPAELWVKGVEASASGPAALPGETALKICGPEHICLEALNNGTPYVTPYFDRVGFTVVAVDLEIYMPKVLVESMILEDDELSKGSVTFVNLDNDDGGEKFDSDPTKPQVIGGDNELVRIKLKLKPSNLTQGQVKLSAPTGAGNIAVWEDNEKLGAYTLGTAINIAGHFTVDGECLVKTQWVEGILAHTGTQRTELKMEYTVDGVSCNDDVALTVLGIESVKWKAKANAYTADGKCNADTLDTHSVNGVLMERVFPCAATPGGNSKNNVEVVLKLSKATPYALNIPCRAFDVDDPSSDLALDPNDAGTDGKYCDGYTHDATLPSPTFTVQEDNRGNPKSGTLAGEFDYLGCKMATIAVPADHDQGSIDFSVSQFPGDNYKIVANADRYFLYFLRNRDEFDGQMIVYKSAIGLPPLMIKEIQCPDNYSTPNPLVVWRVLHVENDVMKPAGYTDNRKSSVISEVTFDSGVPTSTIRFGGDNIQGDMSSCLDAGGGQGKFENGLLQVPPFIPFYNRTILANGLFFAVLATRLEFNFQAKSTDFFGSLIHIIGHTRYIEKDGGRTRVFVDSLTLVCNPDPPSWNSFVGGTIRIGGKDYLITAAEPYSFFIVGFEQGCTLHDDDDDDRVKTRLDLTAATNAFADAYILVVDDGGGNPSNSGVGVEFVANRDSVGLVKDVIDQGVAQSCASETPNYWVGYVSTAHQGGDATKDHDPDTENVVVLGAATADDSTTQVGNGGDAAWVYVESTHDAEGVTGSGMVQRTAAHEMGHECGLDDAIGGKLMESGGRDTLFIGRDVNLLRCRIISPRKF